MRLASLRRATSNLLRTDACDELSKWFVCSSSSRETQQGHLVARSLESEDLEFSGYPALRAALLAGRGPLVAIFFGEPVVVPAMRDDFNRVGWKTSVFELLAFVEHAHEA